MEYQSTPWLARLAELLGGTGQPVGEPAWLAHIYTLLGDFIENQTYETLYQSNTAAAAIPGNTNENILQTLAIPASTLLANRILIVQTHWTMTNNANAKTCRVRLGGAAGTPYLAASPASNVQMLSQTRIMGITNATQKGFSSGSANGGLGTSTGALVTSALDMTAAQDLVISAQLGNGADSIVLESYSVLLQRGVAA